MPFTLKGNSMKRLILLLLLTFMILFTIAGCSGSGSGNPATGGEETPETSTDDQIPTIGSWYPADFTHVIDVGPGRDVEEPSDIAWDELQESTLVRIHARNTPYRSKWVVTTTASEDHPLVITGVSDDGDLPVITGDDADTRSGLYYLNEVRSVIKIGNYTGSGDTDIPAHVIIENLDIRSGRPGYTFTDRYGATRSYTNNAAAVHIEEGESITIRGCRLHDCGNGLFTSHFTHNILISGNHIYDNGIEDDIYEHNTYTESMGIIYEYNLMGPLRSGCPGNNLKDRSAGTVIRYNWIESGNRQLDLVDTSYESFFNDPSYDETFVYGNILIEPDGAGNGQIIHYGGDSSDTSLYRRGTLYLYHNTIISTRSNNTTLIRLSTSDVTADIRNNIIYTTASGSSLALTTGQGILSLNTNWLKEGYKETHESSSTLTIVENSGNLTGTDPLFTDSGDDDYSLAQGSPCIDSASALPSALGSNPIDRHYTKHMGTATRATSGNAPDIGAFERE